MDYETKLLALAAIGEVSLRMRRPGDWYVSQRVEVHYEAHPGILSGAYGNGATPAEAVEDHWRKLVGELGPRDYIVLNAMSDSRRHIQWNGAAWRDIEGQNAIKAQVAREMG